LLEGCCLQRLFGRQVKMSLAGVLRLNRHLRRAVKEL
jgi:hypothetical protein